MTRTCLDLFSGLGGFSSAFEESSEWKVFTVDIQEKFDPDFVADIYRLQPKDLPEVVDRETGDVIESWGTDPVPFICPECNEPAYSILESAGTKKYWHVGDESCVVEQ